MISTDMQLTEHLRELRKRIIPIAIVLLSMLVVGLFAAVPAIAYLKQLPPTDGLIWHALSPWDGIRVYMQFAFLFALAVTMPYLMYQLWGFAKPGLTAEEQKATLRVVPLSAVLFLTGTGFAYFVVLRMSIGFLTRLNRNMQLEETYGIIQYFSFMFNILIPCALMFELPVVIAFLTSLRIVTPELLRKWRRYCYLVMVILSTMIAPPDFISNILVLIPFLVLYETSIWLSRIVHGRLKNRNSNWEGTMAGTTD